MCCKIMWYKQSISGQVADHDVNIFQVPQTNLSTEYVVSCQCQSSFQPSSSVRCLHCQAWKMYLRRTGPVKELRNMLRLSSQHVDCESWSQQLVSLRTWHSSLVSRRGVVRSSWKFQAWSAGFLRPQVIYISDRVLIGGFLGFTASAEYHWTFFSLGVRREFFSTACMTWILRSWRCLWCWATQG